MNKWLIAKFQWIKKEGLVSLITNFIEKLTYFLENSQSNLMKRKYLKSITEKGELDMVLGAGIMDRGPPFSKSSSNGSSSEKANYHPISNTNKGELVNGPKV